jgi:hypothetical protein
MLFTMLDFLKSLYRKLPLVRELHDVRYACYGAVAKMQRALQEQHTADLLRRPKCADPRHLAHFEHQTFSQHGEDGIVAEILRRVGATDRLAVEIGSGDGLENNSALLVACGWRAVWLEGDARHVANTQKGLKDIINTGRLKVLQSFVTRENVVAVLKGAGVPGEFDFLSLDIDQNTYWLWDALRCFRPRIVVVEYNANWPASLDWKVPYDPAKVWDGRSAAYGASLKAFERLGLELGYGLVACDLTGTNAFFVRNDLLQDRFVGPFDAETHYEPPRYFLNGPWCERDFACFFPG